jgi:hypothetical protein
VFPAEILVVLIANCEMLSKSLSTSSAASYVMFCIVCSRMFGRLQLHTPEAIV